MSNSTFIPHLSLIVLLFSFSASSAPLFEAYSKIISGGVQVGFVVQRYEFDNIKKEFYSTYYLRTNQLGGDITESLKARANAKLEPVHYRYTRLQGAKATIVEAQFSGLKMNLSKNVDGKTEQLQKDLPPKTFLGTFLTYVMLKSPQGMKTGIKYNYKAIAEEDGSIADGLAFIKSEKKHKGISVFRILNEFKGQKYVFLVTPSGQTIKTKSPIHSISTEVVATAAEATKGFVLNTEALKLLFGSVPSGKSHPFKKSQ